MNQRMGWVKVIVLVSALAAGLSCRWFAPSEVEETPVGATAESPMVEPIETLPPRGETTLLEYAFGGLTLEYPRDWATSFEQGGLLLAESQEILDSGDFSTGAVMLILSGSREKLTADLGAINTADDLIQVATEGFGGEGRGEIETRHFATQEGRGVALRWMEDDRALKAYLSAYLDEDVGAVLMAVSPEEQWDEAWPLFDAILSSLVFYPPLEVMERGGIELGASSTAVLDPGGTDMWTYQSPGDEYVTVDVVSMADWDPTLEILNEAGDVIAQDDDSGGNYNPRVMALYLLAPGRYEIRVSSYSGYGEYQVTLSEAEAPGGGNLTYGETVQGHLEEVGEREVWAFEGSTGDVVIISMVGLEGITDTYLELYGPDGALLIADDDSGEEYFALIEGYELPQGGTYRIVARAFGSEVGEYELSLEKSP